MGKRILLLEKERNLAHFFKFGTPERAVSG